MKAIGTLLLGLAIATQSFGIANAADFRVIYEFKEKRDLVPEFTIARDHLGNFYGINSYFGHDDGGAMIKVVNGEEKVERKLHQFKFGDVAEQPASSVVVDRAGNVYGTSRYGGDQSCIVGCGVVFKVAPDGQYSVIYEPALSGGHQFAAPVLLGRDGEIFGITGYGGTSDKGVLFKLPSGGAPAIVLHNFGSGQLDGVYPTGNLVEDGGRNLYGITDRGGQFGYGTVFKIDANNVYSIVHTFGYEQDGRLPTSITEDGKGNLYGTTVNGGADARSDSTGYGTVYKIDTHGTESVLHSFSGYPPDGAFPEGPLVVDKFGNLYGMNSGSAEANYCGSIFEINNKGLEITLHQLQSGKGPCGTFGGLIVDHKGRMYGLLGGGSPGKAGTIFQLIAPSASKQ